MSSDSTPVSLEIVINRKVDFYRYADDMPAPISAVSFLAYEILTMIHHVHDLYCKRLDKAKVELTQAENAPEMDKDPLGLRVDALRSLHLDNAKRYVESLIQRVDDAHRAFGEAMYVYSAVTNYFYPSAPGSGCCYHNLMRAVSKIIMGYCDENSQMTDDLVVKVSELIVLCRAIGYNFHSQQYSASNAPLLNYPQYDDVQSRHPRPHHPSKWDRIKQN